jgi:hypothetical protein
MSTTIVMHRTDTTGISSSRVTINTDADWLALPASAEVVYSVPCDNPHCLNAGGEHRLDWGTSLQHKAFSWAGDAGSLVEVVRLTDSRNPDTHRWAVEGFINDDDLPLSPQRVSAFLAHYNSAATLADELNGDLH